MSGQPCKSQKTHSCFKMFLSQVFLKCPIRITFCPSNPGPVQPTFILRGILPLILEVVYSHRLIYPSWMDPRGLQSLFYGYEFQFFKHYQEKALFSTWLSQFLELWERNIFPIIDVTVNIFIIFSVLTFFLIWKILNLLATYLSRG